MGNIFKSLAKILGGMIVAGGGIAISVFGVKKAMDGSDEFTSSVAQMASPKDKEDAVSDNEE